MTSARLVSVHAATAALLFLQAGTSSAQYLGSGIGLPTTPGPIAPPGIVAAQGNQVLPGVRTSLTVSDNLFLRPRGAEAAGFRAEVAPYIQASTSNSRVQASLAYTLRALHAHTDGNSSDSLRNELSAAGNALLVGDWLGVQGSARVFDTSTSPFAPVGADPATSPTNRSRVSTVSLSPYAIGRIGSLASFRTQYTITHTDVSGTASNLLGRQNEQLFASLASGPNFRTWGWSLTSSGTRREFANGVQLHSASTVAALRYTFSPELRAGLTANYAYFERLTNTRGQSRSWGEGFTLDWVPSTRTTVRLSAADQYYGTTANVSLSHRAQRWTFGLNYYRLVSSFSNQGLFALNLGRLLSADGFSAGLNPIFQQLVDQGVLDPDNTLIGAGIINDSLIRQRGFTATIGYLMPRGSLALTGFRNVRETLLESTLFLPASDPLITTAFGQFETIGATLTMSMPFDPRNTAMVSGSIREVSSLANSDRARISLLNLSLRSRLDPRTSVTAGYRRAVQSAAQGGFSGYDENAIYGTLDMRF